MSDVAGVKCRPDVVDHHAPNLFRSMLPFQKIAAQSRGDGLRKMLVLGDGIYFLGREAAQGHAVFKRNQGCCSSFVNSTCIADTKARR